MTSIFLHSACLLPRLSCTFAATAISAAIAANIFAKLQKITQSKDVRCSNIMSCTENTPDAGTHEWDGNRGTVPCCEEDDDNSGGGDDEENGSDPVGSAAAAAAAANTTTGNLKNP